MQEIMLSPVRFHKWLVEKGRQESEDGKRIIVGSRSDNCLVAAYLNDCYPQYYWLVNSKQIVASGTTNREDVRQVYKTPVWAGMLIIWFDYHAKSLYALDQDDATFMGTVATLPIDAVIDALKRAASGEKYWWDERKDDSPVYINLQEDAEKSAVGSSADFALAVFPVPAQDESELVVLSEEQLDSLAEKVAANLLNANLETEFFSAAELTLNE